MAMSAIQDTERNGICNFLVDAVDGGSAGGVIEILNGAVVLAILTFSVTAFGASASGVATAAAISDETSAIGAGTQAADGFRVSSSNAADTPLTTIFEGTVTASGGGGDMILTPINITNAQVVQCPSFLVTMPASG